MDLGAGLDIGGNDVTRRRVVANPAVPDVHRTLPEAAEFVGSSSRLPDARLDRIRDRPQVNVAGAGLAPGVGHPDPWTTDILVIEAHGLDQCARSGHAGLLERVHAGLPIHGASEGE